MMGKVKQDRKILGTDGELHDGPDDLESQEEMVFCTHCGAMNRSAASYCRSCGRALEEQAVDPALALGHPAGLRKQKEKSEQRLAASPQQAPASPGKMSVEGMFVEMFTLIAVIVLSVVSAAAGAPGMIIPVLIAWFMVVAARNGALH